MENNKQTYRKIIHVDMDAFYASIEQRDNPQYKGKPLVVGGKSQRGVVAAASYEARKFGIKSAMAVQLALKKLPDLIIVSPRFEVYKEVSLQIRDIFFEYTHLVEPLSLDEAFLDVTKNNKNIESAIQIAEEIKEKIYQKTNLTASAGISVNKFLAKVASDMNKPNGLYLIRPEHASQFVEELPVHKFFGIGKATAKRMSSMAINTGADLKKLTQIEMVKKFGKSGLFFYEIVRGEDNRPVNPDRERKSVGVERTFENDIKDINELQLKLNDIVSELVTRINKHGFKGKTLSLKIKYFDFKTISRSTSSKHYFTEQEEIQNNAVNLLRIVENIHLGVRLLGLSVSNSDNSKKYHQLTLPF